MPNQNNNGDHDHVVNIIIGVGGSGATTLRELNAYLAQDQGWRRRIPKEICYVLFDTDRHEIADFRSNLKSDLGSNLPIIRTYALSQGYARLQEVTNQYFENSTEDDDPRKSHWWFDESNEPFRAPRLMADISIGAGQCPNVSTLLAWRWLSECGDREIADLVRTIERECAPANGRRISRMDIWIVSSLAGGTGRGCWSLLTFAFTQAIAKAGYQSILPKGFFFDASVFGEIRCEPPFVKKINSLTGLSELGGWMENIQGTPMGKYRYQLPSLKPGAAGLVIDCEIARRMEEVNTSPVAAAFLFFANRSPLKRCEQYKEMLGAGLYAFISTRQFQSDYSNWSNRIASLGALTFGVETIRLRKFFEARMRIAFYQRLATASDGERKPNIGSASAFLVNGGILFDMTKESPLDTLNKVMEGVALEKPARLARLWEEYCKTMLPQGPGLSGVMAQSGANAAKTQKQVQTWIKEHDARVKTIVPKQVKDIFALEFRRCLMAQAKSILRETGSVRDVMDFCDLFKQAWKAGAQAMIQNLGPNPDAGQTEKLIKKYEGREYLLFGERFNPVERERICNAYKREAMNEVARRIAALYVQEMGHAMDEVASRCCLVLGKYCDAYVKMAKSEQGAREKEKDVSFAYETLFTDPLLPEESLHGDASELFYKRILKPVVFKDKAHRAKAKNKGDLARLPIIDELAVGPREIPEAILDLLAEPFADTGRLDEFARMLDPSTGSDGGFDKALKEFRSVLRDLVEEKLFLPLDFVNQFALCNDDGTGLIKDLMTAFEYRLNNYGRSQDKIEALHEDFANFFGFGPALSKVDGQTYELLDAKRAIESMACSAAGKCRPYWNRTTKKEADAIEPVLLFLPLTQDEKLKGRIRDSVSGTLGLKEGELSVAFLEKDVDGNENGSRFAIIACVSERATRLADLADVNYWKDSPCPEWMQKCEQKDGESFFVSDDGNKGVGFTDPVFVRDPVFSDLRWKPWMVIVDDEKAKAIAPVYDAMIYALMDVVKIPGPEGEIVRNAMARCNWQLPLVIRGDTESNNRYQFTRRAYREYKPGISDTPRENTKSWNRKQGFGLGVRSVLGVFSGTDSHKEDKGIEWRQCILEEKAIFDKVILGDNGIEGMARTKFFTAIIDQFAALRDEDFNIEPDRVVWQELIDYLEKIRS